FIQALASSPFGLLLLYLCGASPQKAVSLNLCRGLYRSLCRIRSASPEPYSFEARPNFALAFGVRGIPPLSCVLDHASSVAPVEPWCLFEGTRTRAISVSSGFCALCVPSRQNAFRFSDFATNKKVRRLSPAHPVHSLIPYA